MAKVKLAEEWTTKVQSMNWVQIQDEIASIAKDESENKKLKAEDPDLSLLKEQVKEASKQYTEASAMNKAKLEYAIEIQLTRGRPVQNPNGVVVKKEQADG
jgi:hypothetical protein